MWLTPLLHFGKLLEVQLRFLYVPPSYSRCTWKAKCASCSVCPHDPPVSAAARNPSSAHSAHDPFLFCQSRMESSIFVGLALFGSNEPVHRSSTIESLPANVGVSFFFFRGDLASGICCIIGLRWIEVSEIPLSWAISTSCLTSCDVGRQMFGFEENRYP